MGLEGRINRKWRCVEVKGNEDRNSRIRNGKREKKKEIKGNQEARNGRDVLGKKWQK